MSWPAPTIHTHEFYLRLDNYDSAPKWGPDIAGCPGTGIDEAWTTARDLILSERGEL